MNNELRRVEEINKILETNPNMWHGAKVGYKAERARIMHQLFKELLEKEKQERKAK